MFIIILLLSFFTQINASDEMVISVEEFLRSFGIKFKSAVHFERDFVYTPLHPRPTENLITIHSRQFDAVPGETASIPSLLAMCAHRFTGGAEKLVRTFKVYDPKGILMRDSKFAPALRDPEGMTWSDDIAMYRARNGTRPVGIYSHEDIKICFKQDPEAPGIEVAAYHLYKILFQAQHGDISLPASELILMDGKAFLVSEFMEGEALDSVLDRVCRDPTQSSAYPLNIPRFQRLAIFCLLTVPEDCHVSNCFIRKILDSDEWEFVFFDNERSFGKEITTIYHHPEIGDINTRCHCDLFCFGLMLAHMLTEGVYNEIVNSKSEVLALGTRLFKEHSYQSSLVPLVQASDHEKTILGIPFDADSIKGIISRFSKLIDLASSNRHHSLASIFAGVSPVLASIYEFDKQPIVTPATTSLVTVKELISRIDSGRGFGPTPRSARVPLELYFGTTKNNLGVLLYIFAWVRDTYEATLDTAALEGVKGIIGLLTELDYRPTSL